MSVQDDQAAAQEDDRRPTGKPEPDADAKQEAAEMLEAYKDKPTLVLPGTGGSVSGTAINEWLDEDGNPKIEIPDNAGSDEKAMALKDQIEKDKALNVELEKAAAQQNKGEKD